MTDRPTLVPPPPPVDPKAIKALLPYDSIRAIDYPLYASAAEADAFMDPGERVIGVVINGDARAYPLTILSNHEIVNDVIGNEPVAVTWCPLCYTALVFSRRIEGFNEPLTLGVSGRLLYETLVMFDRQTGSLWSQMYGAAVDGPMAGARLAFFSSTLTEWNTWQAQHTDTLVLSKPLTCEQFNCGSYATNPRRSYDVDPYAGYYNSPDEGVIDRSIPRDEGRASGRPKDRVVGIRVAGVAQAYPYLLLEDRPLFNDEVNGVAVLVWFDPDTQTGVAYLRQLDDEVLTFKLSPEATGILIDQGTGSRWEAMTGKAISGPHKGRRLLPLITTSAFEFGWTHYFPDSEWAGG